MEKLEFWALVGPTGIGKTSISMEVADYFKTPILSVDSMQIYRYMDIGTAKPSSDEQKRVPHLLIDIVNPDDQFDANSFQTLAWEIINDLKIKNQIPWLTGGTGFYLKALTDGLFQGVKIPLEFRNSLLLETKDWSNTQVHERLSNLDPFAAKKLHFNDRKRVLRAIEVGEYTGKPLSQWHIEHQQTKTKVNSVIYGLYQELPNLYEKINKRVLLMMDSGWIDEVCSLRERGYSQELQSMQGLGYKRINQYLDGLIKKDELVVLISQDTRNYARRQMVWFRSVKNIQWFDVDKYDKTHIIESIIKDIQKIHN